MSATSTGGRDTYSRASGGRRHVGEQEVEGAGDVANRFDSDARTQRRCVQLLMPEQNLDHPDIGLLLQEMGGKAVPQGVNTDTLGDAGACRCQATSR